MTEVQIVKSYALLKCEACGEEVHAGCNCGVAYKPVEIAKKAIEANPEKSNRALAKETGVSEATIRRTRASCDAPDKVVGLDGKTYTQKPKPDFDAVEDRAESLGWHLDRGEARTHTLWKNVDDDRPNAEMLVSLKDAVDRLDAIEADPTCFDHLARALDDESEPEADDDKPAVIDLCISKISNALDAAELTLRTQPEQAKLYWEVLDSLRHRAKSRGVPL